MSQNVEIPPEKRAVDVEKVIAGKNPALLKILPGFLLRYLKRTIHQDEINDFMQREGEKVGLDFVQAIIEEFRPEIDVIGIENIQLTQRIVVASNHPLGGLDGIVLMHVIGKVKPEIQFPVNDILLYLTNLQPLFVPINKHGSNADNIRILNQTFESDAVVCYFPFGLVSRKRNGIIRDLDWKKTFLSKARAFKRDIIPTHINGRNSAFFYNLSNFRKALGIKANIEMLYLPDEFFKQKGKSITITFGKPIPYTVFDKRFTDVQWAEKLRGFSYYLGENPDAVFDPQLEYFQLLHS
ncbi:MAG: glycerol acyltransferase [Bacteroidales bacterium]|nr:glycerol acyltransferase [Bacteroidales bacterium]